jgi:glutathione S-transferase
MKLYDSIGPNPHVVRMFAAEKGIELQKQTVDLMTGENRKPEHLARNPMGQLPALELDDGRFITEITAICEYLEEIHPTPALIGADPQTRANTRMWTRRVDINICEPMTNGFRYAEGLALFKDRIRTIPQAADDLKALAEAGLSWLDSAMTDRAFVAGDTLTLADILLFCFTAFGAAVGQPIKAEHKVLTAWFERMKARPSAAA